MSKLSGLKIRIFKIFIWSCCFSLPTYPQSRNVETFSIQGRIIDAQSGAPIEYTTASLFNKVDSSLVTGNITDEEGNFYIEAPEGTYWLEIKFISYKSRVFNNLILGRNNPNPILGEIKLALDTQTLSEVIISGEKEQMELSLDKRIFNVAGDLTNVGRNAAEILDNVPSVTVDVEGNVSLRGSSNVRILIDGKPSGLVGISSTDALRMLQGDLIERVEVITNPSARYDAEGMAGIINIILKKDKREGVNGSFNLNLGHPVNYGASFNINMRRKWFNLFSSYGLNYRESPGRGSAYQEFYLPDSTYYTNRIQNRLRSGLGHNLRFGSDFFINDKNIITASFLYRISNQDNLSNIQYTDLNSLRQITNRTLRTDNESEDQYNLEWDLNYSKTFNKKGQKFTTDIQYRLSNETEKI
ncbi:hypothetical protein BH23BAC1_BH23BAC1_33200 [soil metagenome]